MSHPPTAAARTRAGSRAAVSVAVIDAGIAIGWIQGRHQSQAKLDRLLRSGRDGQTELVISVVNLADKNPEIQVCEGESATF